jgi:hypothetical protein
MALISDLCKSDMESKMDHFILIGGVVLCFLLLRFIITVLVVDRETNSTSHAMDEYIPPHCPRAKRIHESGDLDLLNWKTATNSTAVYRCMWCGAQGKP